MEKLRLKNNKTFIIFVFEFKISENWDNRNVSRPPLEKQETGQFLKTI